MKTRLTQAFIIIALMFMSISVLAQDVGTDTEELTPVEACAEFGLLSDAVFDARQGGASLTAALMEVEQNEDLDDDLKNAIQALIVFIYEQPRYGSSRMIMQQKIDLRNEVELMCISNT
jgi:hypothetical protein